MKPNGGATNSDSEPRAAGQPKQAVIARMTWRGRGEVSLWRLAEPLDWPDVGHRGLMRKAEDPAHSADGSVRAPQTTSP